MVRRMAAGISHDFNNILMVIKGYADLLANDPEVTDRTRDHLGIVLSATEQAAQLVSRLMAFSRQQVLDRTVCCLNVIVDSVLERHRELPINHVKLDVELDQSLPPLYGDPELIAEARADAEAMSLDPDYIEDLMRVILKHSKQAQERTTKSPPFKGDGRA